MDDGLQNPVLAKDLSIAVVDARRGFGNGHVIPAGPLRAPLAVQINLADLIVADRTGLFRRRRNRPKLRALTTAPIVSAQTRAEDSAAKFLGQKVIAFAGIANPDRFFSTLGFLGAEIVERRAFADHHVFSEAEARDLIETAGTDGRGSRDDGERSCETTRHDRRLRDTQGALGSARDQNGYRR